MGTIEQLIDRVVAAVTDFFAANPELMNTLLAMLVVGFLVYVFLYDNDTPGASSQYQGFADRDRYDDPWDGPGGRRYRQGYNDAYREQYERGGW